MRNPVPLFLGLALCLFGCGDLATEPQLKLIDLKGKALGTTWSIKILSKETFSMNELESEVMQKLEAADKLFSHWRADSALFQFNATLKTEPQSLHP